MNLDLDVLFQILNLVSILFFLAGYILLAKGRLDGRSVEFYGLNMVGSILGIIVRFYFFANVGGIILYVVLIGVSIYGIYKSYYPDEGFQQLLNNE